MPQSSRFPCYDEPLPQCKGPKLSPFQGRSAAVNILRLISENDPDDTTGGGHTHVFEASINSKIYALKVVRSCPWMPPPPFGPSV